MITCKDDFFNGIYSIPKEYVKDDGSIDWEKLKDLK